MIHSIVNNQEPIMNRLRLPYLNGAILGIMFLQIQQGGLTNRLCVDGRMLIELVPKWNMLLLASILENRKYSLDVWLLLDDLRQTTLPFVLGSTIQFHQRRGLPIWLIRSADRALFRFVRS